MARPINTHRQEVLSAQKTLREAARQVAEAGYTLDALLTRANVTRERWRSWMTGRACPQGRSLDAIKLAARLMVIGEAVVRGDQP